MDILENNNLLYEFVKGDCPKNNYMLQGNYLTSAHLQQIVLHKIESLGFDTEISTHDYGKTKRCYISQAGRQVASSKGEYKLAVVFEAVVIFVKWYTETRKS